MSSEAGRISGSITSNSSYTDIVIFAYSDGTRADAENDEPVPPAPRFPNAVNSGKMRENGHYTMPLVAAGTYHLAVAGYNSDVFGEVLGFVSDVVVESRKTTKHDIDAGDLASSP